jgi:hypothetical protein
MWATLFSLTNGLALAAWVILAFLPRKALSRTVVMYLGVGLLCLTYTVLLAAVVGGGIDPVQASGADAGKPGFTTIAGIRAIFGSDGGVVIGWTHYLAFDLFAGLWIANDADHKGFSRISQVPFLFVTFMAGPVGLLAWLMVRERRARAVARGA